MSEYEAFAIKKFPVEGKCPSSPFANGWHRAGLVPVESVLDGGLPGDSCETICLHCGRWFHRRYFLVKLQPRTIAEAEFIGNGYIEGLIA